MNITTYSTTNGTMHLQWAIRGMNTVAAVLISLYMLLEALMVQVYLIVSSLLMLTKSPTTVTTTLNGKWSKSLAKFLVYDSMFLLHLTAQQRLSFLVGTQTASFKVMSINLIQRTSQLARSLTINSSSVAILINAFKLDKAKF